MNYRGRASLWLTNLTPVYLDSHICTCLFAPEGPSGNSPAIYRWEIDMSQPLRPVGTLEILNTHAVAKRFSRPSGTSMTGSNTRPSDKSLGYDQVSLRDRPIARVEF
jgi:hypothetical protein